MGISDLLADKIWGILQKGIGRIKTIEIRQLAKRKKCIILGGIILVLGIGIVFNAFFETRAYAQKANPKEQINDVVIDPLNRIDMGLVKGVCVGECQSQQEAQQLSQRETELHGLVAKNPIAEMVPFIAKRDKRVASFLVAIAKKESDWGKHTPKKNGKECYNFWGYRGKENTTESGYSCFDSPEHAVKVVGDRIEKLVNKKVDTPAKMVVWKCGGDCNAAGGQAAANKWISDVAHVYKKLQS